MAFFSKVTKTNEEENSKLVDFLPKILRAEVMLHMDRLLKPVIDHKIKTLLNLDLLANPTSNPDIAIIEILAQLPVASQHLLTKDILVNFFKCGLFNPIIEPPTLRV